MEKKCQATTKIVKRTVPVYKVVANPDHPGWKQFNDDTKSVMSQPLDRISNAGSQFKFDQKRRSGKAPSVAGSVRSANKTPMVMAAAPLNVNSTLQNVTSYPNITNNQELYKMDLTGTGLQTTKVDGDQYALGGVPINIPVGY